jgi:aspartate 1-decarboxylase
MRLILRAKIHKAHVTSAEPDYIGSISVDEDLMDKADLWPGEKVMIASNTSGERLETYVIPAERGSGMVCMNGAAAKLIKAGEEIIIMSFEVTDKPIKAKSILVDSKNRFVKFL